MKPIRKAIHITAKMPGRHRGVSFEVGETVKGPKRLPPPLDSIWLSNALRRAANDLSRRAQ
jgi:hypothetical protein